MRVAVTGASGFIGSALVERLRADGDDVRTLVRRPPTSPAEIEWDPAVGRLQPRDVEGTEAVVHLAGAGIGDHRWTPAYQDLVLRSREQSTRLLTETLLRLDRPPRVLLSGSAIGWYGDTGELSVDESGPGGQGFLADVCRQWEAAAAPAANAGIRTCLLRSGIVLGRSGGALRTQLPLFRLGLGGPLGSGRQWQSWITLDDEVRAIGFLLAAETVSGPVNLTAPEPVRQRELARALGDELHRPAIIPVPRLALRAALGGFADEGVLASQRVLPAALQAAGFTFDATDIRTGLRSALAP